MRFEKICFQCFSTAYVHTYVCGYVCMDVLEMFKNNVRTLSRKQKQILDKYYFTTIYYKIKIVSIGMLNDIPIGGNK